MLKDRLILIAILLTGWIALSAQSGFDINKFSDPTKYRWQSLEDRLQYRNDLYERQKLLQIYEMDAHSISGNVLKSAVIPGWGQFNTKNYTKGQVFLGVEIALFGASLYYYDKAMTSYRKYENANQIDDIQNYYKDAQGPYQYSIIFLSFASMVWAYNIFDVIQSTESYNVEVWNNTIQKYYQQTVSLTPIGLQVRF